MLKFDLQLPMMNPLSDRHQITSTSWISFTKKFGLNQLRGFFSTYMRNIHPHVRCPMFTTFFTARCYASAVLDVSLCPSVTTPDNSPRTLVFWCQRSPRNSTGVTPYDGAECRWGGQNWRLSTNNRLYLENGKR